MKKVLMIVLVAAILLFVLDLVFKIIGFLFQIAIIVIAVMVAIYFVNGYLNKNNKSDE
jgi:hypothetical protein